MTDGKPEKAKLSASDRRYLRFVVAAFVLLGLLVLGVFLFEPVKLRYAIYRVRKTGGYYEGGPYGMGEYSADEWLTHCLDAACRGNRAAMQAVVDKRGVMIWHDRTDTYAIPVLGGALYADVACVAAWAQPELFFEVLDERDDKQVREVLWGIHDEVFLGSVLTADEVAEPLHGSKRSVGLLVKKLEGSREWLDPRARHAVRIALELARRRFAGELAEAARKKGADK